MPWTFNPFTFQFDYYKDTWTVVEHSTNKVLSYDDFKKVHVMNVAGGDRIFTLPAIDADHLGWWVKLVRNGTANKLTVQAGGTDVIWNSSAGGYIECEDASHDFCSVNLVAIAEGQWTTPEFGVWSSY